MLSFCKCNIIYKYLFCIYSYLKKIIIDTYLIFFKNIYLYYNPIEIELVYDTSTNTFISYNTNIKSDIKYLYFYKINNVDYKKYKFYNYGYYYHISNNLKNDLKNEIAYVPDTIEYIKLIMTNNNETYEIKIDNKFIGSILYFSTKQSYLKVLLYYYLQYNLNNYDKIVSAIIKLELDDIEKDININEKLENIYNKLE